jgi:hypothetical protein
MNYPSSRINYRAFEEGWRVSETRETGFPTGRKFRQGIVKSFPAGRKWADFLIDNMLAYVLG